MFAWLATLIAAVAGLAILGESSARPTPFTHRFALASGVMFCLLMCVAMLTALSPDERPWNPVDQPTAVVFSICGLGAALAVVRMTCR
jgi:hypothetical protein